MSKKKDKENILGVNAPLPGEEHETEEDWAKDEDVQEFYPALKLKALENRYRKDYQAAMYSLIGMRSTLFQAVLIS